MNPPPDDQWDVAIVGAGVAGAVAAFRLARRGLRVLLADKADWPRDKVCGGCINAAALHALAALGLTEPASLGQPYAEMRLSANGRQARVPLPAGRAISRRRLDAALVEAATEAGAVFSPATRVAPLEARDDSAGRRLELRRGAERWPVRAKIVLACDGLNSRLLQEPGEIQPGSRIGVGAVIGNAPSDYRPGIIYMACGAHGYAGLVRVEDRRLDVAAALDPDWIKHIGGPAAAVTATLRSAGLPLFDALASARWRGTPQLTRRHGRLGGYRLLALGDAAGYVEPFTGEGMAWAIASAAAIEPFVLAAVADWRNELVEAWTVRHRALIRNRQRACRGIATLLRRPRLVAGAVRVAAAAPAVAAPLTAWLNRDFKYPRMGAIET
ncbi:MAG TPA: FAD-dependent oxidoreductase [Gammaproteobacteria bacterium]|nr:FAD-dependent oxidoreductase [Gammaproteobacteria bacterium]